MLALAVLLPSLALAQTPAQTPPPGDPAVIQGPTFKTGVDLIRLDVTVVEKDGNPIADLNSEDFEVRVDGKVRPVVTSRFLSLAPRVMDGTPGSSLAATRDYSGNDSGVNGRLLVLAVDHESLPVGAGRPLMIAASELLHRMGPADKVALVLVPQPGQRIEFTNDIEEVKRGLSRITGRRQTRIRTVRLSFDEAQAVERNEQRVIAVDPRARVRPPLRRDVSGTGAHGSRRRAGREPRAHHDDLEQPVRPGRLAGRRGRAQDDRVPLGRSGLRAARAGRATRKSPGARPMRA